MPNSDAYLLDTNVLIHLIRGNELGARIDAQFRLREGLHRSLICVVTAGELYAFAARRNWGAQKRDQLEDLLGEIVLTDISHPEVLRAMGSKPG